MSAGVALETREARAILARHGRSFHWAGRLLGRVHAERCARLYAFCRTVDDLVDEGDPATAGARLAPVRTDLERGASADPVVASFLALDLDRDAALHFVDGVARDLRPVAFRTEAELLRYAYGVAGTVGALMCGALSVRDDRALPFAIDLGIAMQLTNIARDVLEDAERGRRYLPAEWVGPACSAAAIGRGDPGARLSARSAVDRLLRLADRYYRSADAGMHHLPRRSRLGILTASRVYGAIGGAIRRRGNAYWGGRAVVSAPRKLGLTLAAGLRFALDPRLWHRGPGPRHFPPLHAALRGLPGADPAA